MIKNGYYFASPDGRGDDFKALFKRVAAEGVGRPADKDGFPQGPWTPELLTEAISQIDANQAGIELRTVQLWFQDNEKGISADNIRWLARILGCNDPNSVSAWQAELSAAQARLTAKRRAQRRARKADTVSAPSDHSSLPNTPADAPPGSQQRPEMPDHRSGFSLARVSERIFSRDSTLNLPAAVFAGAVALQFLSYFLGLHSVSYLRTDGVTKQVGFLWAPNWTFLFAVFMPLFLAFVVEQVKSWKDTHRPKLLARLAPDDRPDSWTEKVQASSYTFWVVFLVCIGFAGVVQWVDVRLLPLLTGGSDYAIDWGSVARVRPDEIGIPLQAAFTGLAYFYMAFCFYLFVSGLILVSTIADDFSGIADAVSRQSIRDASPEINAAEGKLTRGTFRCTIAGLLIAMCMKLQSLYVVTSAPDIWHWLSADAGSVLHGFGERVDWGDYSMPTHYTSLLVAFLVCAVFLYSMIRFRLGNSLDAPIARMAAAVAVVVFAYLMIGVAVGFSLLLGAGLLVAVYGLADPGFGASKTIKNGADGVS